MYTQPYKAFSENVAFAARILNYYRYIQDKAQPGTPELEVLNKSPRFWLDWNYMALQTVIIFLGKIFDTQSRTHNIDQLMEGLSQSLNKFTKEELPQRKIKFGLIDPAILEEAVNRAQDWNIVDITNIQTQVDKAKELWEKFKPLRNRIYAHQQMLTDQDRDSLFSNTTFTDLENLVQILINISHVIEQAELNGLRPDFSNDYKGLINRANGEAKKLLEVLVAGL